MSLDNDIDLKLGQGPTYATGGPAGAAGGPFYPAGKPAYTAGGSEILTFRYPDGFKTGIYRYRLVSMGSGWYRFIRSAGKHVLDMRASTDVKDAWFRKGLAFLSIA